MTGAADPDDRTRFVTGDGFRLPIARPGKAAPGRETIYGVRPESFRIGGDVPLRVEVVEPTGSETHVVARLGASEVICVFRERITEGPGDELMVSIDPEAVHLFDALSGERVSD